MLLPRDTHSAKRGIVIISRLSFRLSVYPSVTLMYRGRIGWVSSKVITRVISLGSSSSDGKYQQSSLGETPKIRVEYRWGKIGPRLLLISNRMLHSFFSTSAKINDF